MAKAMKDYDLSIDLNNLDKEWQEQPQRFFQASVALADGRKKARELKALFDITKADLECSIRSEPDNYSLTKLTEATVAACILVQPEYRDAQKDLFNAEYEADILAAYVSALETRRRALGDLVDLHGQGYFSEPRASGQARELMEEVSKREVRQRGRKRPEEDD